MNDVTRDLGRLYVIAAASGTGKTSLVQGLIRQLTNIVISISHTTRLPRPKEIHGQDYFFINDAEFKKLISQQIFLEYAQIYDYHYGTSRAWVMQELRQGKDVVLEIDWQGALQIRERLPEALLIFILPPTLLTLKERLQKRQQDSLDVISKRLASAQEEIAHYYQFDYLIVNDDFDKALSQLSAVIIAERCRRERQEQCYARLLTELLHGAMPAPLE